MHRVGRWFAVAVTIAAFSMATVWQAPPAAAQADTGNFVLSDWWWQSPVLEYRVNLRGAPPGALAAINQAAETWNSTPGTQVQLRYVGATTAAVSADDGVNTIYWGSLGGALGRTGTQLIIECNPGCTTRPVGFDILLSNTAAIRVGAIGTQNFDLESLMLHEFGHALGLDHADASQVMFGVLTGGTEVRALASGDRRAIETRYPNATADVNCDRVINIIDALAVAQYAVDTRRDVGRCPANGSLARDSIFALMGDANADTRVNVADAFLVAKCAVGLSTPICPGQ